jgi:hypothetical protein
MHQDKLKITAAEAHILRDNIKELNLKTPEWFELLTYDELASCYNGVGSDNTPKVIRKVLTRLMRFAKEAVLIHDAEYQYASRFWAFNYIELEKFHTSNRNLGENAVKLAKERTPWYSPLRYFRIFVARHAHYICDEFGYDAWTSK